MEKPLSENEPQQTAPVATPSAAPQETDRGFPADTPIAEMSQEQQTAYWKHYARQHENTVKEFKGITPQSVADMRTKLEALETDKLTADEKALKAARTEASTAASEAVKAEFLPKLQAAEVKSIAAEIITGDQLKSFLSVVNPAAFVGDNGEIDESKVIGALTGMFGAPQRQPVQRWQNAGQYSTPPPPGRPGESGRAEAARRFGSQTTS